MILQRCATGIISCHWLVEGYQYISLVSMNETLCDSGEKETIGVRLRLLVSQLSIFPC